MVSFVWIIVTVSTLFVANASNAADIRTTQTRDCLVEIDGEITHGDAARLMALSGHLLVHNGESTSESVLCLDSPGGSVIEGLKMARFIMENGISTYIGDGDVCASICAIMFMMGNYRGSEVAGLSRTMHYRSQLGFHRPYLEADEARSYTSDDIESVYRLGVETVFDIFTLANTREPWGTARMIEAELMAKITGTPGSEMFYVTTVEEAERWRIFLDGLPDTPPGARKPQYACENALAYPVALPSELNGNDGLLGDAVYDFDPLNAYNVEIFANAPLAVVGQTEDVASIRAGYSGVGCKVAMQNNYVAVCGYDGTTDTYVGACTVQYGMRNYNTTVLLHPKTEFRTLGLSDGLGADARRIAQCEIWDSSNEVTDSDPCLHSVIFLAQSSRPLTRHVFDWPSGARTIVDIGATSYGETSEFVRINGESGSRISKQQSMQCVLNETTGNTLCVNS
ncbi:hypothetical protein [Thalassorhabdomicrobium marinisediminis]|uniref:Lipoprotein n=1 Tax=Thalassorhabdomicrobium marinisediminis TaxID=2170577 RepID=A0A2T7FVP0_9RHOB|nr:hypothetical protein [Thalassorhabdomicrobium marinisediminis]PVA06224.1 hypothetical protein DC363_09935 [Thalassorhabdomicrobium marinisediminis]